MARVKKDIVTTCYVQDEVNWKESEQDEVDRKETEIKKQASQNFQNQQHCL